MKSFANEGVRLVLHDKSIIEEDHLDQRWEEATGEPVDEVIFLSKHTAVSNRPALTVHPIGEISISLVLTLTFSDSQYVFLEKMVTFSIPSSGAGVPHLREGEIPPQGGKPGWAAPPSPRIGPWLRLLKNIAHSHNLVPEFEVSFLLLSSF
jgi:D-aminoacyl-tRNA deacylase